MFLWWRRNALLQGLKIVGIDRVVIRRGILHSILAVPGPYDRNGSTWAAFRVSGWKRLEVVTNTLLFWICYGKSGHAPISHPKNKRPEIILVEMEIL